MMVSNGVTMDLAYESLFRALVSVACLTERASVTATVDAVGWDWLAFLERCAEVDVDEWWSVAGVEWGGKWIVTVCLRE